MIYLNIYNKVFRFVFLVCIYYICICMDVNFINYQHLNAVNWHSLKGNVTNTFSPTREFDFQLNHNMYIFEK